jgi:hypothetical protein
VIEERLLGFDLREAPETWSHLWDDARRTLFLLRPDVARPLSTDTMVWPSIFDHRQGIGLEPVERSRLGLAGIPLPDYTGPNAGLWQDEITMTRYLGENRKAARTAHLVAVTWLSQHRFAESGPCGPFLNATDSDPAPGGGSTAEWMLLGFDVADSGFLSGLSNCGYSAEERPALREQWAPLLNDHHLFAEPIPAFAFRALTDARVPEHAPFFVYGLHLIQPA